MTSRRRLLGLVVAIASLFVGATTTAFVRRPADPVTIDEAVSRFRAAPSVASSRPAAGTAGLPAASAPPQGAAAARPSAEGAASAAPGAAPPRPDATAQGSPRPDSPASPADGVYTYETEGYERTDALGGSRHDYPKQTAVTVTRSGCGWTMRWQPLDERWDESEHCQAHGGIDIRRFSTFHEFFQRTQQQDFLCPPGSFVFPPDPTPGRRWTIECRTSSGAISMTGSIVGREDLVIGGRAVPTTRVHYDARMTGSNRGTQVQDRWFSLETGLNLQIVTEILTETDSPFGAVNYEERYRITATSLTPRR